MSQHRYDPNKHNRRSIRLKGYDYTQAGLYFITFCVRKRYHLFGRIPNKTMLLNAAGNMIAGQWLALPQRFPQIQLHEFVVMPNHFHSIIEILPMENEEHTEMFKERLGDILGAFKSITTVEYIKGVKNLGWRPFDKKLWQRNFWEKIIRDERAYWNISNYIIRNPSEWNKDKFY